MLKRRFRHCAQRSFMLLRRYKNRERSVQKLQLSAEELLKIVSEIPGFPILKETYREILEDYMHIDAAKKVLKWIHEGAIKLETIGPNRVPSPFAHNIVVQGYSDVVLMEDRKRLLRKLYEQTIKYIESMSKIKNI